MLVDISTFPTNMPLTLLGLQSQHQINIHTYIYTINCERREKKKRKKERDRVCLYSHTQIRSHAQPKSLQSCLYIQLDSIISYPCLPFQPFPSYKKKIKFLAISYLNSTPISYLICFPPQKQLITDMIGGSRGGYGGGLRRRRRRRRSCLLA